MIWWPFVPPAHHPLSATSNRRSLATHLGESSRQSWVRTVALFGIGYALVSIVFAVPATHVQAWRLAAWGLRGT